jgi:mannose-6-phosphate isomerase-like protein (cupin superfamily)
VSALAPREIVTSAAVTLPAARAKLAELGRRSAPVLARESLEVLFYALEAVDDQKPHRWDELYIVQRGTGTLEVDDGNRYACGPGTVLFVAAGVAHRFVEYEPGFAVWAIFWGPEGGEQQTAGP